MRKIILNLAVSLDGFIEGPNGEFDWCLNDQDYGMAEFFFDTNTVFIGRKSYELVAGLEDQYFPGIDKVCVFSDTITEPMHPKVDIITSKSFDERVKQILSDEEGGQVWLFGGANLLTTFLEKRLVTEMLLSVHPVILGGGKPLFQQLQNRVNLLLIGTQAYDSGLVQLRYTLKPEFDYSLLDASFTNPELNNF
jgi:dihydrofolate reductase